MEVLSSQELFNRRVATYAPYVGLSATQRELYDNFARSDIWDETAYADPLDLGYRTREHIKTRPSGDYLLRQYDSAQLNNEYDRRLISRYITDSDKKKKNDYEYEKWSQNRTGGSMIRDKVEEGVNLIGRSVAGAGLASVGSGILGGVATVGESIAGSVGLALGAIPAAEIGIIAAAAAIPAYINYQSIRGTPDEEIIALGGGPNLTKVFYDGQFFNTPRERDRYILWKAEQMKKMEKPKEMVHPFEQGNNVNNDAGLKKIPIAETTEAPTATDNKVGVSFKTTKSTLNPFLATDIFGGGGNRKKQNETLTAETTLKRKRDEGRSTQNLNSKSLDVAHLNQTFINSNITPPQSKYDKVDLTIYQKDNNSNVAAGKASADDQTKEKEGGNFLSETSIVGIAGGITAVLFIISYSSSNKRSKK